MFGPLSRDFRKGFRGFLKTITMKFALLLFWAFFGQFRKSLAKTLSVRLLGQRESMNLLQRGKWVIFNSEIQITGARGTLSSWFSALLSSFNASDNSCIGPFYTDC